MYLYNILCFRDTLWRVVPTEVRCTQLYCVGIMIFYILRYIVAVLSFFCILLRRHRRDDTARRGKADGASNIDIVKTNR